MLSALLSICSRKCYYNKYANIKLNKNVEEITEKGQMSARQKQKTLNSKNSGRFLHIRNLRSVEGILIAKGHREQKNFSVDKLWRKLKIISSSLSSTISRQRGYLKLAIPVLYYADSRSTGQGDRKSKLRGLCTKSNALRCSQANLTWKGNPRATTTNNDNNNNSNCCWMGEGMEQGMQYIN